MIKEFEFFHGVIFSKLIHGDQGGFLIKPYPTSTNASYIINNNIGIYVKYCAKRMSPRRFSFEKKHQNEISEMREKMSDVFTILVCNNDGIVCLNYKELKEILDENHENVERIAISRKKNEKYTVNGKDGKLKYKIGDIEFPKKIIDFSKKQ